MKKLICASAIACFLLSGCVQVDRNVAIVQLQAATANMIGLSSSDELTISNVTWGTSNPILGQDVTYKATTTKGRTFECHTKIVDGTVVTAPSIQPPSCKPLNVYKK